MKACVKYYLILGTPTPICEAVRQTDRLQCPSTQYPHLCRTQVTFANWQKLQQMLSPGFIELLKLLLMMFSALPSYSEAPTPPHAVEKG